MSERRVDRKTNSRGDLETERQKDRKTGRQGWRWVVKGIEMKNEE